MLPKAVQYFLDKHPERKRLYLSHRGRPEPENTVEGLLKQLESCDGIEFDVQLTKDNHVVIFHDEDTSRIFPDQPSRILSITNYQDLPSIPLLKDLLLKIPPYSRKIINIELKTYDEDITFLYRKTKNLVRTHALEKCVLFTSFCKTHSIEDVYPIYDEDEARDESRFCIVDKKDVTSDFIRGGVYTLCQQGKLNHHDRKVLNLEPTCLLLISDDVNFIQNDRKI